MESSTGQPLLFYQLLGVRDGEHPVSILIAEEQQLRASRDTLAITFRQTAKVLHYHQVKADLLEKYRTKQREAAKVESKLQHMLQLDSVDGTQDDCTDGSQEMLQTGGEEMGVDINAGSVLRVDKRAEKRLRDKLARHAKNMADLRRKLMEEDKRERARRRKVRAKREAARGRMPWTVDTNPNDLQSRGAEEELYMEDWETILTHCDEEDAERFLESVHERRLEHEFLLQAVKVRLHELAQREEQVVEKLTHALKLQYRKIALRYHPDRSSSESSTEMFQLLSKAYAVVSDTPKRRVYNDMGNHTLYLCVHEQDKDELRMADIRDARKAQQNQNQHGVLRITSGAPNRLRCPTVRLTGGSSVQVSWEPFTDAQYTYSVSMESDAGDEAAEGIVYEGTESTCTLRWLGEGDYVFKVRAANALGAGVWSEPVYASILEGGGMVNPYGRGEKMAWQQAKMEAIREDKRKRRKRKEQKRKERKLQREQRSHAEQLLLRYRQASQQIMRLIHKEKPKDLHRLMDRLLARGEGGEEERAEEEEARRLIVNWTNARGETPLIVAAMKGASAIVRLLLDKLGKHVNLDDTDNHHGRTALLWAVVNGDADMLHAITSFNKRAGGDRMSVNWQDYEGYTALHWAAELGQSDAVGCLLRQPDIDVDVPTYDNSYTPLHIAASHGHFLIVQLLYEKGLAIRRREQKEPHNHKNVDNNINDDDDDHEEDQHRRGRGEEEEEEDEEVLSPAFLALMNEHYEVALWLVRAEERRLLESGQREEVRRMKGALVHLAAMLESLEMVRLLVEGPDGADLEARDEEGNSPLHLAYQVGNDDVARYLEFEAGSDPQATNHQGLTPVQMKREEDVEEEEEEEGEEEEEEVGQEEAKIEAMEDENEDEQGNDEGDDDEEDEDEEDGEAFADVDAPGEPYAGECHLYRLPQELVLRVLGLAYARDVCAMRQTASAFQGLAEDNALWRKLFLRTFPFCFEVPRAQTNWRALFASQIAEKKRCVVCCRVDQLRVCSGCRLVHYCGHEHQRLHWRVRHRETCEGPFRLLSAVKRPVAEDRAKERVQKALSIFGLVELSLKDEPKTDQ